MKTKQPDFQKIFFDTFTDKSAPTKYSVRADSYLPHDTQFMSGLIHDASFMLRDVQKNKGTLTLKIKRDCWEYGRQADTGQLLVAESLLIFTRVRCIKWVAGNVTLRQDYEKPTGLEEVVLEKDTPLSISRFFIGESTYLGRTDTTEFVITGFPLFWEMRIFLPSSGWSIKLSDLESPKKAI